MTRYDVLVVGGGPAGIAAATVASESGCRVGLIDDNPSAGGQIWRAYKAEHAIREPHGRTFLSWLGRMTSAGVEIRFGLGVVAQPATGVLRVESDEGFSDIHYERLILATGARERFLPFPGWTLPGVMGAGGLQAMVKCGLPIAGKRVVLAGSGPLLLAVAAGLARRGAEVAGIFEQAPMSRLIHFGVALLFEPGKLMEGLRYRLDSGSALYSAGSWVTRAYGRDRLRSVTVKNGGAEREIACEYLGCGFHLVPNLELPGLLGCSINGGYVIVDEAQQTSIPGLYCAGELTGIGGLEKALIEGEIAGLSAAGRLASALYDQRDRLLRFARRLDKTFAPRPELRAIGMEDTLVCRCEDVARGRLAGLGSFREAKLQTRCGMGPCQGRICGPAAQFLFGWKQDNVRPPLTPSCVSTLAPPVMEVDSAGN
jgi:NADPH-dependent 2,4-dienoyl-CoA reductase/sulfur reductase-like enzyme